jgi:hypothetical protein
MTKDRNEIRQALKKITEENEPMYLTQYAKAVGVTNAEVKMLLSEIGIVPKVYNLKNSICWKCKHLDCPWMLYCKPIAGWQAEQTLIEDAVSSFTSYDIKHCPQFEARAKTPMGKLIERIYSEIDVKNAGKKSAVYVRLKLSPKNFEIIRDKKQFIEDLMNLEIIEDDEIKNFKLEEYNEQSTDEDSENQTA